MADVVEGDVGTLSKLPHSLLLFIMNSSFLDIFDIQRISRVCLSLHKLESEVLLAEPVNCFESLPPILCKLIIEWSTSWTQRSDVYRRQDESITIENAIAQATLQCLPPLPSPQVVDSQMFTGIVRVISRLCNAGSQTEFATFLLKTPTCRIMALKELNTDDENSEDDPEGSDYAFHRNCDARGKRDHENGDY